MTDVLSDVMQRVRLTGCVYFERDFFAPWSMRMADTGFAQFHIVTSGACMAEVAGRTFDVGTGDVLFFPRRQAHVLADRPGRSPVEGPRFMASLATDAPMFADGHAPTRMICGHYAYRSDRPHPLLDDLPGCVHLKAAATGGDTALPELARVVMGELSRRQPGFEVTVERLAEAILVQVLRAHYRAEPRPRGFYAALQDPRLSRAVAAIHSGYASALTLTDLAARAAMSRSAFAQRFAETVRMSPIDYLQLWRLLVARDLLASTDLPVADVAEQVGYGSDIAFARAFKRRFGLTPAATRRR